MKKTFYFLFLGIFCFQGIAGDLDIYRRMKGTDVERQLLNLARQTIKQCLNGEKKQMPAFSLDGQWPGGQVGVFVTLVKDNTVRACVGNFYPQECGFLDAIIKVATQSTYLDARFKPISPEELNKIRIIISVTGTWIPVSNPHSIDFKNYGLLIKQGDKTAVLLPGEAKTTNWGLKMIAKKAGITSNSEIEYYQFETITFEEAQDENPR